MKKIFLVLIFALLLASCGGDDGGPEKGTIAMSDFFDRYLTTLCDAALKCPSGFVNAENHYYCPNAILNYTKPFEGFHKGESVIFKHKYEMLINAEQQKWVSANLEQADICLDIIANLEACNPLDVQLLDIPECAAVFQGKMQLRDECYQDEECKNGWCNMNGGICPGTCVDYKLENQSCNSSLDRCIPGYECRTSGCSKSSSGDVNEPCVNNSDCKTFLFCYVKEGDSFGTCLKRKGEGQACSVVDECVVGLSCVNNLCSRSRISDQVGTKCGPSKDENGEDIVLECNSFSKLECGAGSVCQKMPASAGLPCSEACDADAGLYCDSASHSCQRAKKTGGCEKHEQCTSFYCAPADENSELYICQEPQCLPINVTNE